MASQVAAGKRMGKLRETFLTALTACKEQGVKVDMEELFPGLYTENKEFFDGLLGNMLQLLRDYSQDEFDKICQEKNVAEKLNELDGLHAQQAELDEVGISIRPDPESKTAQSAVNKASNAAKRAEAEALRSVLASLDAKNKQLEADVGNLASDAQGVSSRIEGAVASMNEVATAADSIADSVPAS